MDRNAEVKRLNKADRHIIGAEKAISRQRAVITKLATDGKDLSEAEKQLTDLEATLSEMHRHRDEIIRTIRQIDAGEV
jgi:hypothetical protein